MNQESPLEGRNIRLGGTEDFDGAFASPTRVLPQGIPQPFRCFSPEIIHDMPR